MPDFLRVNNTRYSWLSSRALVDGQPWESLVAVDYEQKRERKIVHSMRQDGTPVGWTSGKYSVPSFKLRMLKEGSAAFEETLAAGGLLVPGLGSYGDAEWTFLLQAVEPVVGAVPLTLAAAPCAVGGKRETREEGFDELVVEYDVYTLQMIENGIPLWSLVRSLGV